MKEELAQQALDLQTPLRKNRKGPRAKEAVNQWVKTGRLAETVIGQLTERFHIEKVRARDAWHLTNRCIRKWLAHTVGVFLNLRLGSQPLLFDAWVAA